MTQHKGDYEYPVSWGDVYSRIGDESIIAEFAESFIKNGQTLMLSVKSAVQSHSIDQIELYAHALKGSASNIGAISLAKAAWKLEKAGSDKDISNVEALLNTVEQEYQALITLLEQPDWIEQAKKTVQAGV